MIHMTVIDMDARRVDRTIGATVRALLSGRGVSPDRLAEHLGISRGSLYDRMRGAKAFRASEVARSAAFLGVAVADLYDGLNGKVTPPPDPDGDVMTDWKSPSRRTVMALVSSPQVSAHELAAA